MGDGARNVSVFVHGAKTSCGGGFCVRDGRPVPYDEVVPKAFVVNILIV